LANKASPQSLIVDPLRQYAEGRSSSGRPGCPANPAAARPSNTDLHGNLERSRNPGPQAAEASSMVSGSRIHPRGGGREPNRAWQKSIDRTEFFAGLFFLGCEWHRCKKLLRLMAQRRDKHVRCQRGPAPDREAVTGSTKSCSSLASASSDQCLSAWPTPGSRRRAGRSIVAYVCCKLATM